MNPYVISALEQQWRKDPNSRVFFRLAEEYRRQGMYDKAIEVCRDGVKRHPTYLPARVCLGRCYQSLGSQDAAESEFREVIKYSPDNPHALSGLANICFDSQRLEEALSYYELILIQDPGDETSLGRVQQIKDWISSSIVDSSQLQDETLPQAEPDDGASEETVAFHVEEEEPELLSANDLEMVSDGDLHLGDLDKTDELDQLDLEFEKAIQHADQVESVFEDEVVPKAIRRPLNENQLTLGLKHEKMEHYEAALHIYQTLWSEAPGDPTVRQHLDRIEGLLSMERGNRKKIRLLSNWMDKIKGVYYVS